MNEGSILKEYITTKNVDVSDLAEKLKLNRTTIYTHYKKDKLKQHVKDGYTSIFGVDIFNTQKNSKPRLEAIPLHLAADPNDYDNDGSQFEELPDGTIRMRVPIIPHKAFAGYLRGFKDPEYYEDMAYTSIEVFKQHRGHYLAFEVKGDSMTTLDPEHFRKSIFDGVKVIGRELPRTQWLYKLHTHSWGAWVIVHRTEGILIKAIIGQDVDKGIITIHSLNPDKETYPDQDLYLDDIEQIFNVVKKLDD
jgi:phage repressor protein C with HTH and peptisase S24 domain